MSAATAAAGVRLPPTPHATPRQARTIRRRVAFAWGLLVLNSLTFYGTVLPLPRGIGQIMTQAALPAALVLLLTVNRRIVVRPNVFLCLVTVLLVDAFVTVLQPE